MKLNGVLDHYDDDGLLLKKAFAEKGVPPVIKTAVDLSETNERYEDDYALVVDTDEGRQYKYPVVDAGNTLASALYFSDHGTSLPEELQKTAAAKIHTALETFGFTPPEELTKSASMELGYSDKAEDTSLERLFGLNNDDSVEIVENAFAGLSPRGKRRLSWQVKEASADVFNLLSDDIQKYASADIGSDFKMSLDLRKMLLVDEEANTELDKIAEMANTSNAEDVAEALYNFDVQHAITHQYNRVIPDSFASVYGNSVEKNASVSGLVEVGGKEYSSDTVNGWFNSGGEEKITEAFGDSFAGEFKADPAGVLSSLPVTHKKAIARMIDVDEG
tara:strand:+ start:12494 stop:13492 length:999 start_codon:yes stop_codon:yes gene_type:complete